MRTRSTVVTLALVLGFGSASRIRPGPIQSAGSVRNLADYKGHRSISANVPEMTPEGEARLDANKPTRGRFLGEPLNGQHRGFVRAVRVPSMGNDPVHQCNPNGFPRLLLDPEPVEFVQTQGRLLQLFQWERTSRTVDGRTKGTAGENLANLGPAWYGHTAGQWEGTSRHEYRRPRRPGMDRYLRFSEKHGDPDRGALHAHGPDTIELRMTLHDREVLQDAVGV